MICPLCEQGSLTECTNGLGQAFSICSACGQFSTSWPQLVQNMDMSRERVEEVDEYEHDRASDSSWAGVFFLCVAIAIGFIIYSEYMRYAVN